LRPLEDCVALLVTPQRRIFLGILTIPQTVEKFSIFSEAKGSWLCPYELLISTDQINPIHILHIISSRSILMFNHPDLDLQSGISPQDFLAKILFSSTHQNCLLIKIQKKKLE
jgi:hypothetical protein